MSERLNGEAIDVFDLNDLRLEDTGQMNVLHPKTGEPTNWVWTLAGPGHPASIEAQNEASKETLRITRLREQAAVNRRRWVEPERDPEEIKRDNALAVARRVLGWTPIKINKEDYPFSRENTMRLLLDPAFGKIYLQVLEYFNADDSFTKRSATVSQPSLSESSN